MNRRIEPEGTYDYYLQAEWSIISELFGARWIRMSRSAPTLDKGMPRAMVMQRVAYTVGEPRRIDGSAGDRYGIPQVKSKLHIRSGQPG